MSQQNDSNTVRTAGMVLLGIGILAWATTFGWNAMGDHPDEGDLVSISGIVEHAEVREISTRTSIKYWDVIDVVPAQGGAGATERWVFPEHSTLFDQAIEELAVGDAVSARVRVEPELLRWSDEPVRIVWALAKRDREVVSYAEVVGVLAAARYQSPTAGLMVAGVGIALMLASRIRFHQVPHTSP